MKLSIRYQLFLSILAATCVALLCMFVIMVWSINRGFLQYIETIEQGRIEKMVKNLEQAYAEHKSWDFLRENPGFWMIRLLNPEPGHVAFEKSKDSDEKKDFPPMSPLPHMGPHRPRWPFIVLDAKRNPLFGRTSKEVRERNFRPIIYNKETVGYIGGLPPKSLLNPQQLQFLSQQKAALILSAIGLVIVVALFSLPLANRLLRPLRAMAAATHDLASGKYAVRVPVTSSDNRGDELEQLSHDFNTMAFTLEKNEKARRQWVADISHELRTPLSILRGEIEAVLEGIRAINPEAIRSFHAETLRLNRLVDDLYQLALSDLGSLTYHREHLDLAEVLKESTDSFRTEFTHKGIELRTDISPEFRITLFADPARLHQLFTNILDNSLKYTDPGGELVIRLAVRNGQAVIDFEDSAPGVPEDQLDRLFDRLYRVEGSRNRAWGGAGLGLTICRNIVEAHGGAIAAFPSRTGGVLISITFPVIGGIQ